PVPLERVGIADTFAESGPYAELLEKYGLGVEAIAAAVRRVLHRRDAGGAHALSKAGRNGGRRRG
ncbi:MAG: hypothetical protein ACLQVN_18885, partial [Bryobacteraceae bacterium]